jgi:hypothetical protein
VRAWHFRYESVSRQSYRRDIVIRRHHPIHSASTGICSSVQFRRLLLDIDLEFGAEQRHRGSEAADHRDPERRGQWPFIACQCASASSRARLLSEMTTQGIPIIIVVSVMRRLATVERGSPNIADPSSGLVP